MTADYDYEISYGKARVPLYRVYATPLSGVTRISESSFSGRDNMLFAMEIDVEVFGNNFLPAYISGDNANVVATDSMKNFILRQALAYEGSTLEGFLDLLGRQFLGTYPQMEKLRITGRELPFTAARVPQAGSATFGESNVLFSRSRDDFTTGALDFAREGASAVITAHRCGRVGLQLLKVTGSSFTHFLRDAYSTLPERVDRPLFIYLAVFWKYTDLADISQPDLRRYPAAEHAGAVERASYQDFVSESIAHLVHKMGLRLLE